MLLVGGVNSLPTPHPTQVLMVPCSRPLIGGSYNQDNNNNNDNNDYTRAMFVRSVAAITEGAPEYE